jgi:hypothetical protein
VFKKFKRAVSVLMTGEAPVICVGKEYDLDTESGIITLNPQTDTKKLNLAQRVKYLTNPNSFNDTVTVTYTTDMSNVILPETVKAMLNDTKTTD